MSAIGEVWLVMTYDRGWSVDAVFATRERAAAYAQEECEGWVPCDYKGVSMWVTDWGQRSCVVQRRGVR